MLRFLQLFAWRRTALFTGRCLALWLGAMAFIDLLSARVAQPDALLGWWLSTDSFVGWFRVLLSLLWAATLLAYAWQPRLGRARRFATAACLLLALLHASLDAVRAMALHADGAVPNPHRVPLSALLAAALALVLWGVLQSPPPLPAARFRLAQLWQPSWWRARQLLGTASCALLFALAQMVCFGNSDYRRPADAVVVFGARVYRSGTPSLALADRVRTAARLVRQGYAPRLLVSGGPGDGDIHEVEAMRAWAISEGVPAAAVVMDRHGLTTRATVRNTRSALGYRTGEGSPLRVLAVSHGYHLPRIKLSYQQQGIAAYTVPARETRTLVKLPWYMAREGLAFWAHALRLA